MPKKKQPKPPRHRNRALYGELDGRSAAGRRVRRIREDLLRHLGPAPSPVELALVQRCAWLTLHMAQLDDALASRGGVPSDHASAQYIAWSNALMRTLYRLGIKGGGGGARPVYTLRDHLAERVAAERIGAAA